MKDNIQKFYNNLKQVDDLCYLENYLKYQLAPVIKGVKPSSTLNMTSYREFNTKWDRWSYIILEKLGLECVTLRETKNSKVLLFYKQNLIEDVLTQSGVKDFLRDLGYLDLTADKAINHLAQRYKDHHCPHELGIFLGIPLEDVKDFMDSKKKKCLMCGYWKVYSHVAEAIKMFNQYDTAKYEMLQDLLGQLNKEPLAI